MLSLICNILFYCQNSQKIGILTITANSVHKLSSHLKRITIVAYNTDLVLDISVPVYRTHMQSWFVECSGISLSQQTIFNLFGRILTVFINFIQVQFLLHMKEADFNAASFVKRGQNYINSQDSQLNFGNLGFNIILSDKSFLNNGLFLYLRQNIYLFSTNVIIKKCRNNRIVNVLNIRKLFFMK